MSDPCVAGMDGFFRPRGIAIMGASAKAGSAGHQIVEYARQTRRDEQLQIYPVNPARDEIAGLKCYPDLVSIAGPVDLVVIVVPAKHSVVAAQEIARRRGQRGDVGAVVVITAGFKEMATAEGVRLQQEMIAAVTACGARLIGPNCVGVVDTFSGVNTTFSVPPETQRGGLTILSQSGAFATSFLRWARELNLVGINKFVSLGNMGDVDFTELLAYVAEDEQTRAIAMYLDGMSDARRMFEVAAKVTRKKPIVVIKAGKTSASTNVAQSHTASIAGNNDIYDGAFRQSGIIRADTVAEFYHTSRVFDKAPLPRGNRICVMSVVGGPSTICVDALMETGEVTLAHLREELRREIAGHLSASANVGNPDGYIDMTASVTPQMHTDVLKLLLNDDEIDGIIFMTTPPGFIDDESQAASLLEAYRSVPEASRKPVLSVLLAGNAVRKCRQLLEAGGMPTFEFPDEAAKVMVNLVRYSAYRQRNLNRESMAAKAR